VPTDGALNHFSLLVTTAPIVIVQTAIAQTEVCSKANISGIWFQGNGRSNGLMYVLLDSKLNNLIGLTWDC